MFPPVPGSGGSSISSATSSTSAATAGSEMAPPFVATARRAALTSGSLLPAIGAGAPPPAPPKPMTFRVATAPPVPLPAAPLEASDTRPPSRPAGRYEGAVASDTDSSSLVTSSRKDLMFQCARLMDENEKLKALLAKKKAATSGAGETPEIIALKKEIAALKGQVYQLRSDKSALEERLRDPSGSGDTTTAEMHQLHREVAELRVALRQKNEEMAKMSSITIGQEIYEEFAKAIEVDQRILKEKIAFFNKCIKELSEHLTKLSGQIRDAATLATTFAPMGAELRSLEEEVNAKIEATKKAAHEVMGKIVAARQTPEAAK